MQKRRGLVSLSSQQVTSVHASTRKRGLSESDADSILSESESSGLSSPRNEAENSGAVKSLGDITAEVPSPENEIQTTGDLSQKIETVEASQIKEMDSAKSRFKGKGKGKSEKSDEDRFKKMKLKGSEKEILVDMSRVQKYVDYDSAGVMSYQDEVKQAKGNFRQQSMADYSDL